MDYFVLIRHGICLVRQQLHTDAIAHEQVMEKESGGRASWADIAKAIGILLVVYGHVARGVFSAGLWRNQHLFKAVDSVIYSFHMPLFFLLSGLFFLPSLQKRGASNFAAMKVDTVIYPYIVWSLLQGGIEATMSSYTNSGSSLADVLALFWAPRAQFWFLYALFILNMLCIFLYRRASPARMLICTGAFVAIYLFHAEWPVYRITGYLVNNGVFFSLGILIGATRLPVFMGKAWFVVLSGLLFMATEYWFHVVSGLTYSDLGPFALMTALVAICFVLSLSLWAASLRVPLLPYIGTATMAIYLMHILATGGARILLHALFKVDSPSVHLVAGTLVGVGVPLMVYRFLAKREIRFLFEAPACLSLARLFEQRPAPPKTASALESSESPSKYA